MSITSQFRYSSSVLTYQDQGINSNPSKTYTDWSRTTLLSVENPKENRYVVDPGDTLSVFSGIRSTSISGTTEFLLTISPLSSDVYRFTWDTVGTNPAFRVNRNLTCNTHTLTLAVNINQTVSLTSSNAGDFSAVVVGDTIFIPGVSTGDIASPFNSLNEGYWQVIGKDGPGTVLQMIRPTGTSFSAYAQAVLQTTNLQILAYSAAGVQVNDKVNISAGFSTPVLRTFTVSAVTPTWFEVVSTDPLPVIETAVPTAAGMIFYSTAKQFIKVEADQECVLRMNGDTSDYMRLSPWAAGDPDQVSEFVKVGPTWSLDVVNKSTASLNVLIISVE
jgi:hypothetical protein